MHIYHRELYLQGLQDLVSDKMQDIYVSSDISRISCAVYHNMHYILI